MAVSRSLRFQILRRDNHTCRYCGRTAPEVKLTVDHVVPEALGGSDDPTNLVAACGDCNGGKSATPPDAAHVEQVSEDAFRWAEAMQAAAGRMLADLAARQDDRNTFEAAWLRWKRKQGNDATSIPLPPEWEATIDRFRAAGLPIEILAECIPPAMTKKSIRDDRRFNYMCGVAWNKVTELQEAAGKSLGAPDLPVDGPGSDLQEWAKMLLGCLTGDQETYDRAMQAAQAEIDELDDEDADVRDPLLYALETVAIRTDSERFSLLRQLRQIVRLASAARHAKYVSRTRTEFEQEQAEREEETPTDAEFWSKAATLYSFDLAGEYLATLEQPERNEWLAAAKAHLAAHASDDRVTLSAAEYAVSNKATGAVFYGMCCWTGDHGAMCPQRATFRCWYEACPSCAPDDCSGHVDWCERHLQMVVDGSPVYRGTEQIHLRDFAPVVASDDPWAN